MSDTVTATKAKAKASTPPSPLRLPEVRDAELRDSAMEVPAAFREFAEKSVSQAKETYEKMKSVAEEATDVLEETYATATKGAADYGLKVIEAARVNTNAAFDFATELMAVKSLSEAIELSTAYTPQAVRERAAAQAKELVALAQKVEHQVRGSRSRKASPRPSRRLAERGNRPADPAAIALGQGPGSSRAFPFLPQRASPRSFRTK